LIDGSGRPPEKNMVLTVEGGEVCSIEQAAASTPGDDTVLDFSGCTILHGLIDAHVHLFMGRANLARMADQETVWVPTAVTMQAYIEYMQSEAGRQSRLQNGKGALSPVEGAQRNLEHQLEQMAMARQLGVRVAVGTDAGSPGVDHGKSLRAEIGLLIRAGYSIPEAVESATRINAQLLGLKDIGCLAAGAAVSFVAVAGSPGEIPQSLASIQALYIEGEKWFGK
jgi:imidazolonepropionase-like amidohydrolase